MTRDDFLLVTSLSVPPKAAAPTASLPTGAAAAPLCQHLFCERKATNGDLCEQHADLMKDLRQEYYDLQREFEAGW